MSLWIITSEKVLIPAGSPDADKPSNITSDPSQFTWEIYIIYYLNNSINMQCLDIALNRQQRQAIIQVI